MKLLSAVTLLVLVQYVYWENIYVSGSDSVLCREEERSALLHIKASLSFPIHSLDGKWEGKECCRWERVTCNSITGHVTRLDLGIHPTYDDWIDYKRWMYDYLHRYILLNATLFLPLPHLRSLSLSGYGIYNCTDGAGLETWSNLTKLEILDLSRNHLDGSIVYDLAGVPSLRTLDLSVNYINNSLSINGLKTWSNLTKLEILDLSDNHLAGSILYYLAGVPSLHTLNLSHNNINNSLPINGLETWSNLTKLEILDLSDNNLDGSIIYDLASVPSLRTLDLSYNNINNRLPINGSELWSNFTKLEMLDLSDNDLHTNFISSLAKISSLRSLYLDYNLNMGDNVPVKELSALNLEVVSLRFCRFNGSLPYVGHWSSLKALSLADNRLNGTLTSKGLCRLKNLEELDLSMNNFAGNLPLCMGNLSSLKLVDFHYNELQIKFPSTIFERLVSLWFLSLSYNEIEGTLSMRSFWNHSNLEVLQLSTSGSLNFRVEVVDLPFQLQVLQLANCILNVEPTFLCSQHKLRVLDLSNTSSKGPLSTVWLLLENNANLITLYLRKNLFTGPLHLPFLTHEKLSKLDISDNHLSGELPANITTKLPNLMSLILSKNYIQGSLPLMPTSNLKILDLSSNNLTDDIQNSFSRIQPSIPSFMDLSNNKFYGSFTNNLNFTQYSILLLNDNNISGKILSSICNTSFVVLEISNNQLNGGLPDCIGKAILSMLKLSGNHLEGSLPLEMCAVGSLQRLDLSDNRLFGSLPTCSNQSTLHNVDLSQNNLTGNFPITWLNISYISVINIRENHLYGELPAWIGDDSNLKMLQASENLFGGPIPKQICKFKYLRILDLSYNNISGQIPSCIIDMGSKYDISTSIGLIGSQLLFLQSQDYSRKLNSSEANLLLHVFDHTDFPKWWDGVDSQTFSLELMSKGRLDYYWQKNLQIQGLIDLSSNKLVGNISEDIGQMNWLKTLNLSNNHLSGTIPDSISNLHQLESLDLSHNSLTGEIPRELTKLTSLASFSVAYNDLSGPTLGVEAQFITFDKRSYEGNPNLCGLPLSKSCVPTPSTTQPSPNELNDNQRYDSTDFLILFGSFSLFFVVSFWCFIVVLYFKRNWCCTLFTLVDQYGDMIYVKIVLLTRKIGVARTQRV